ncbi:MULTISPECIES: DUF4897 domain-containing protein [unclassified Marinitoga]|uniref:DUF4897 domain-containing protein n=1 Tax=unclassified Marinitoga TaxID=2640159 RepID=UPI000640C0AF|nr:MULTISPECIES: DUF4897 domain-containing protein [unclassified Marinitoga]KLO24671.1 hypothetical protein X274_02680 [Marinitoga sp. 1155]NUU98888.1 hypothetical protein [Marinitoga sp. 1154]
MAEGQQKRNSSNFIIFALIFIVGIGIFNYFMAKNARIDFDIINNDNYYYIQDNGNVIMLSKVTVQAKDEKSYNKLLESYKKPDSEKRKVYEDFISNLTKKTGRMFELISVQSTVSVSDGYKINVIEKSEIKGFIQKKGNNEYEFSLDDQKINLNSATLYIYKPENWDFIKVIPNPTEITENYLLWKNTGEIEFPEVTLERK